MELLFGIFIICIFLFFFVPSIRFWVLSRVGERLQKKMQTLFEEQIRRQTTEHARKRSTQANSTTPKEKLQIDEIEAKRFDKENSNNYVDFEELPKK